MTYIRIIAKSENSRRKTTVYLGTLVLYSCFCCFFRPKKAILDCIRVLELDPNNVKAYYRRALAYLDLGNRSEAHNNLLAAFRLDPSNSSVQDMLTKLEKDLGIVSEVSLSTTFCLQICRRYFEIT